MPARRDTSGLSVSKKPTKAKIEKRDQYWQQKKWWPKSESEDEEPLPRPCRVFLYLQLQNVSNLPTNGYNMQLKLSHSKSTITQLDDQHSTGPAINLESLAKYKPTFSIGIVQDNVDDLNIFSDHPLVVTLQKRVQRYPENSESSDDDDTDSDDDNDDDDDADGDADEESSDDVATVRDNDETEIKSFETVACGLVDLLQFFTQGRAIFSVDALLYPIVTAADPADTPTYKSTWEIYTLQPLLKHVSYTNMVYITFESIYNASPELLDLSGALTADLFFQSKIPNEKKEHDKIKICSFSTFFKSIIAEQSIHQRWESVNEGMDECYVHSGIGYTGCTISIHKLFKDLLCAEDAELDFDDIQLGADFTLVSNSVRRYVLTPDLSQILTDVLALSQQQMLIEVYKTDCPNQVLLSGVFELPILLYPKVNCCRFAVELRPAERPTNGTVPSVHANQRKKQNSTEAAKKKKTFATLNICLLTPLTESTQLPLKASQPDDVNDNQNIVEKCVGFKPLPVPNTPADVLAATYKRFDEEVEMLANHIVQNKIRNLPDDRLSFCGVLQNLTTVVKKLVSSDFNSRISTKTNHEFSHVMTIAYRELVQRIYTILKNYSGSNLQYVAHDASEQAKILQFMNIVKLSKEAGDKALGALLFEKLNKIAKNQPYWNFYIFLFNMETLNYDGAKQYLQRPLQERYSKVAYYEDWVYIYLQHLKFQAVAQSYNLAFDHLLKSIQPLTVQYPRDLEAWALLYCMYKSSGYTPGENFTRLKLEALYDAPRREFPAIPKSRWDMYLNYELKFTTRKYSLLYNVMQVFLRIGTFRFAEIIFTQISKMCTNTEKYFMVTTFKILLNEVPPVYPAQTVGIDAMDDAERLKAYEVHTNGHLAFQGGVTKTAMRNYEHILDIKVLANFESFELGLLRYAYYMSQQQKYENVIRAFGKCSLLGADSIITYLGLGKTMYRLNRLQEAEMYFAQCTQYGMHIPDVWAYLALINHKMGYISKAVEFWKYAKLKPENEISNEILIEFSKITSKDKSRFVGKL